MDTLEIFLESNLNSVDKQLDAISSKIGSVADAMGRLMNDKSYEKLGKNITTAYDKMSKTPATNGVTKSLEDSKKSAQELIAEITARVKDIKPHINIDNKSISQLETMANTLRDNMAKAQSEIEKIATSSSYDKQVSGLERYIIRLEEARNKLELVNQAIEAKKTPVETERSDINIKLYNESLQKQISSVQELEAEYVRLNDIVLSGSKEQQNETFVYGTIRNAIAEVKELYPQEKELIAKFETLETKLMEVLQGNSYSANNTPLPTENIAKTKENIDRLTEALSMVRPMELPTDNIYAFNKAVNGLEADLEKLTHKQDEMEAVGVDKESQKYIMLQMRIEEIVQTLDRYKTKIDAVRQDGALELKIAPINEGVLNQFENRTNSIREKLKDLRIIVPTTDYQNIVKQIEQIEERYNRLAEQAKKAINANPDYGTTASFRKQMAEIEALREEYRKLLLEKENLDRSGGFKINVSGIQAFSKSLSGIENMVKRVMSTIGKLSSKILSTITPLKKITSSMDKFNLSNVGLVKSLTKTTKMLGLMIKRMILRAVIKNATDGFKNLAQYSDTFNADVSLLWNSFRQLGNAFASAVAPMLGAFAGALNSIIQLVIRAVNAVNQLISALAGLSTWKKAKELTDDWGKSVEKAGKKANKALQSFDALNNLTSQESSGTNPADMFEDAPISDYWKDWADKFKDMWKNADFFDLGREVGEWLKDLLDNIPWDMIKAYARKIASSLATFLNGFMSVEGLGYSIGRTLAEAFNTAFEFLDRFIRELNWRSLGHFVADTLNGIFENIDWELIRNTFVDGAKGLSLAINQFMRDFHWDNISETISKAINTLTEAIYTFFSRVNFAKLGRELGKQLDLTIQKIDWEMLGRAIGSIIQKAVDFATNFLKQLKWSSFTDAFQKFMSGLKAELDPKVYKTIKNIAKALISLKAVLIAISGIKGLSEVVKALKEIGLVKFAKGQWQGMVDVFTNFKTGFSDMSTLLKNSPFTNNSFANFFTSFKAGLDSVRAGMGTLQKGLISVTAIIVEFKEVKSFFSDLASGAEISAGRVAKLVAVLGGVGVALYTALGPIGLVAGAITLVVGALSGVVEEANRIANEQAGQAIYNSLVNPNGHPISEIPALYEDALSEVNDAMWKIIRSGDNLDIANGKIDVTVHKLGKIHEAFDKGAISAEEAVSRIKEQLTQLADTTVEKIGIVQDTLLDALGENSVFSAYAESLGITFESARATVMNISEKATESLQKMKDEVQELKAIDPNNPRIKELEDTIRSYSGAVEQSEDVIADYKKTLDEVISNIDYSGLYDAETNSFKADELAQILTEISDITDETTRNITDAFNELQEQLQTEIDLGKAMGEDVSSLEEAKENLNTVLDAMNTDISSYGEKIAQTMQTDLVENTQGVIEEATKKAEERGLWQKLLIPNDTFIKGTLEKYQTEVIEPLSTTLEKSFGDLAQNGGVWASDVFGNIMQGLFPLSNDKDISRDVMANDYVTIVNEALSKVSTENKGVEAGQSVVNNVVNGMEESSGSVKTEGNNIGTTATNAITSGAKNGSRNVGQAFKNIAGTSLKEGFGSWKTDFNRTGQEAMGSLGEGLSTRGSTITTWVRTFADSIGKIFSDIATKIKQAFNSISTKVGGLAQKAGLTISLPTFATGGMPEDGLFMANHNELVGKFSNGKTAVANNEQITDGIRQASYEGMKQALAETNIGANFRIEGDPMGMFRVMQEEADDYTKRTGSPAFG